MAGLNLYIHGVGGDSAPYGILKDCAKVAPNCLSRGCPGSHEPAPELLKVWIGVHVQSETFALICDVCTTHGKIRSDRIFPSSSISRQSECPTTMTIDLLQLGIH